jgi:hypothetical protein
MTTYQDLFLAAYKLNHINESFTVFQEQKRKINFAIDKIRISSSK